MGQTQPEAAEGAALPPEMTRFVFQPVDEVHTGVVATIAEIPASPLDTASSHTEVASESPVSLPEKIPTTSLVTAEKVEPPAPDAPPSPLPDDAPRLPLFRFGQNGTESVEPPITVAAETSSAPARRFGSSERLPPSGVAHFQQMLAQFRTFPACNDDPTLCLQENPYAIAAIQSLAAKSDGVLTWEDLDLLEIALLRVLPDARLRSQAWSIRARYFELAGPILNALYLASRPPDWNDASISADLLRADLEALVSETQRYRVLPPEIDFSREFVSESAGKWALGLCLGSMVGFVAAHFVLADEDAKSILPLAAALVSGAAGGFLSLQSRLSRAIRLYLPQQEQVQSVLETPNLYLYPVQGTLLAAFFYFLLLAGFLKGKFFPSASTALLATPEGGAKLIVWCFLIGLLVRFLPDIPKLLHRRRTRRPPKARTNISADNFRRSFWKRLF